MLQTLVSQRRKKSADLSPWWKQLCVSPWPMDKEPKLLIPLLMRSTTLHYFLNLCVSVFQIISPTTTAWELSILLSFGHLFLRKVSRQGLASSLTKSFFLLTVLLFLFVLFFLREAKALYSCEAEHSHELSFPQGALFSNGKKTSHRGPSSHVITSWCWHGYKYTKWSSSLA